MNNKIAIAYHRLLFYILLFSIFLLPAIPLKTGWPKIQIAEILLPFLCVSILLHKHFLAYIKGMSIYLLILLSLAVSVFISMVFNHRLGHIQDYFEILKIMKYAIIMIFIAQNRSLLNINLALKISFFLVMLFNTLHYTNFLNFNTLIEKHYSGEIQMNNFGVNSLGQPATKRMLGTLGNPNDNAILFLFFIIYFFPTSISRFNEKLLFYTAVLGLFFCQSRTGFIAFFIVYSIAAFLNNYSFSHIIWNILIFGGLYGIQILLGNLYLSSLATNIMEQNSVRGRLETWKMLFEMIKQKPLFGYAPYKEYFYANKIYAESQYVLTTWRYGILGLLLFLLWMFYSFIISIRTRMQRESQHLLLFLIVLLITSITNVPISNQTLLLVFAIVTALYFHSLIQIPEKV